MFFLVIKRPQCEEFLKFCLERFDVGIWSSNMEYVLFFLMLKYNSIQLVACEIYTRLSSLSIFLFLVICVLMILSFSTRLELKFICVMQENRDTVYKRHYKLFYEDGIEIYLGRSITSFFALISSRTDSALLLATTLCFLLWRVTKLHGYL